MKIYAALLLSLSLAGCACSGDDALGPDAAATDAATPDASEMDAGAPVDGSLSDAGPTPDAGPADTLTIERWGERLYGSVLGMTRIDRELWIGTSAVIDPTLGDTSPIRSALARLDLDTGALRVFEDELPRVSSADGVMGPTPTAGVVGDGARRLVASFAGLLVVEGDSLTLHELMVDGERASATHLALERTATRARLWASTSFGLLELDPDTFAVRSRVDVATLGGVPGSITVDPTSGAVFAGVHPGDAPSFVARVLDAAVTTLVPGEDGVPDGDVGDVVWSSTLGGAFIALGSYDASTGGVILWDGVDVRAIADEAALSLASHGIAQAFGTSTLAYDESAGVLVVGARIRSTGPITPLEGGGLAWIDVSDADAPLGIVGLSSGTSAIRGDMVTAAAYDPVDHRTYLALQQPCSEVRIGNVGIHSVYFEDGAPRFELPILSSVRDLERVDGELWVGLRDDNGGLACLGIEIQVGFARVDGSRGALVPELRGWEATTASTTEIAFRGPDQRVVGGWRSEFYVGGSDEGITFSPPLALGTSLFPEDVEWEDDRTFWVAGHATHSAGDEAHLADVGPRGAARVVLNDAGAIESVTQYVRQARDPMPNVIEGLPSAEVYDVVVDAAGAIYLVCGTEHITGTSDRIPLEEFRIGGNLRRGGVVRIEDDGSITTLAGPAVVPDGRAAAFAPDGTLYVLDATRGLLRQTGDDFEVVELAEVPPDSEPKALWVGEDGDLVAGFSTGALVRLGDQARFIGDVGFVWSVEASGEVIYLGTDRGLVRVIPAGVIAPDEPAPAAGEVPPFRVVTPPPPDAGMPDAGLDGGLDGGMCLPQGTPCNGDPTGCCPGLICGGSGFIVACVPA